MKKWKAILVLCRNGYCGSALVKDLGGVCFQLFVIFFISSREIQKLDDTKSEKLEAPFQELLRFSLLEPSSF
jgi:hypothetical protein